MNGTIEYIDDFFWPKDIGKGTRDYLNLRKDVPQRISKYVKNKGVVVHAGGNVGFYARQYSSIFDAQYVFEPECTNFLCLTLNVLNPNTHKFQSFLGDVHQTFMLERHQTDCGGHNLGKRANGKTPMLKIDDLGLSSCDLIHLDVEGAEPAVIEGALDTINKFFPVICAEVAWSNISNRLSDFGYVAVDEIDGDLLFIKT